MEQIQREDKQLQFLSSVTEKVSDAIIVTDTDYKIIYINDATQDLFGYKNEELMGKTPAVLNAEPNFVEIQDGIYNTVSKGGTWFGSILNKKKDGSTFVCECKVAPHYDDEGQIIAYIGIQRDITERKQEEQRHQAIIQAAVDGFWMCNMDGRFLEVNDSYCKMIGYSREELLEMSISDIEAIESTEDTIRHIQKLKRRGHDRFETKHKCKDGNIIDVEISSNYLNIKGGIFYTFVRDITKRKEAEKDLLESERRYRDLYDNAPVAFYSVGNDGYILGSNKVAQEWLGYFEEELKGMKVLDIYTKDSQQKARLIFQRFKRGETIRNEEMVYVTKDKKQVDGLLSVNPIKDADGNVVASRSVVRDISELKRMEVRYKTIIDTANDGFHVTHLNGRFVDVNNAYCRMLGYSRDEILSMNINDIEAMETIKEIEKRIASIKQKGYSLFETRHRCKDGKLVDVEVSTHYLNIGFKMLYTFVRNITNRKQTEKQLKQYQKHLKELVKERTCQLSSANEQLERMLREQRDLVNQRADFTRALVHELKTPLTAIVSSSEVLTKQLKDKLKRRLVKNIHNAALNLDKRINELLDLAKGEVGTLKVTCRSFNPLKLIREVANEMIPEATKKGQSIVLDIPSTLPNIWADRERIRQVILNLTSNALKFNADKGQLTIRAKAEGTSAIFEIQDEGRGLTEKEQQRLFQPYYRVESDREKLSGLGLGLALSKRIVELNNGKIWVKSKKGKGSTFTFSIPFTIEVEQREEGQYE